jgi:predicted alpha/beta superfamily hydrolase
MILALFRNLILLVFLFISPIGYLFAQVTLLVDAIPANTPSGDNIYVAGNFQNWQAGDPNYVLQADGQGHFLITLNSISNPMKFKFTRGSWSSVEGDANGNFRPDRTFTPTGSIDTLRLQIQSWEDLSGSGSGSTANEQVSIMDPAFAIPQLNRNRRIWIYLPADYATSNKSYPVLYLQDGQNLFDAQTSFAGEWQVDETLTALEQAGDYGIIVVGIDNGGANRISEYSPWVNPSLGGGDGDKYIDFIIQTLKPHIDSTYRTLPGRETTGILGSSMGGLIAHYGGLSRQDVFGKVGVFSPSFWFSPQVNTFTRVTPRSHPGKFYFLAGANEGGNMVSNMRKVYDEMLRQGFDSSELKFEVKTDGQHAEWFWGREFGPAYQWLFGDLSLAAELAPAQPMLWAYPNPVEKILQVQTRLQAHVQLFDLTGKLLYRWTVSSSAGIDFTDVAPGVYLLRINDGKRVYNRKLVRR